jgi:NitT/TauT family transport system substrate-binding protein
MYMSTAFLEKKPDLAAKAMKAYFDAVDFWIKNPAEGNAIIAKAIKFDVADVENVIGTKHEPFHAGIYVFDLAEAGRFMGVVPGDLPFGLANGQIRDHWKLTTEWWLKFGLIKKAHPIESGVSFEPIKSLAEAAQ